MGVNLFFIFEPADFRPCIVGANATAMHNGKAPVVYGYSSCALRFELATSARSLKVFILFVFKLAGLRPCIAGADATAMAQR